MKPYAVIHYLVNGKEQTLTAYTQGEIDQTVRMLKNQDTVFWTCLCNTQAAAPRSKVLRPPERAQERLKRHG